VQRHGALFSSRDVIHAVGRLLKTTTRRGALATALPLAAIAVPIPAGWPHHLALGLTDQPGGAQALESHAPLDMRYQYLAGGVNTGHGWSTWNENGTFASMYVSESINAHVIPVLTYYQLLQSYPAAGTDELHKDISNVQDAGTMRAYWSDYELLMTRVAQAAGSNTVIIHVEPDLWGYLEQAGKVALARQFARKLIALRNRIAPHVLLAWHLSVWGTKEDPTYSKPSLSHMTALGATSAAFYESLHAHFDLVFNDVIDRDAGFYKVIYGNRNVAWGPADFHRHDVYIASFARRTRTAVVLWQLPLGNTMLNNTRTHFRDNRVQWWLGAPSGPHLRATCDAGVIGLLFGGGAAGTTSADTDGGLFYRLARGYEAHPLVLPWAHTPTPWAPATHHTKATHCARPRSGIGWRRVRWRQSRPRPGITCGSRHAQSCSPPSVWPPRASSPTWCSRFPSPRGCPTVTCCCSVPSRRCRCRVLRSLGIGRSQSSPPRSSWQSTPSR
jgi:hypothetical protein